MLLLTFSSDDDARQAMMKSGHICAHPIRLFLSSRAEMQSVIAQARATPMTKPLEPSYPSTITDSSEQNGATMTKLSSANAISSLLAEFQAKTAQVPQQQQVTPTIDPTNALLMAAAQNGGPPLTLQQLLSALNDKQLPTSVGQTYPFQMPLMPNPYVQSTNGVSLPPQVIDQFSVEFNLKLD